MGQRVEAVDSGLGDAMQRADVAHNEVQWALQRHPCCMSSLSEAMRKVVGAMRYGVSCGEPWDRESVGAVRDAVEVPQGLTKRQRDNLRKRRRRKQRTGEEAVTPVQRVAEATAPQEQLAEATVTPPERVAMAGEAASIPQYHQAGWQRQQRQHQCREWQRRQHHQSGWQRQQHHRSSWGTGNSNTTREGGRRGSVITTRQGDKGSSSCTSAESGRGSIITSQGGRDSSATGAGGRDSSNTTMQRWWQERQHQ